MCRGYRSRPRPRTGTRPARFRVGSHHRRVPRRDRRAGRRTFAFDGPAGEDISVNELAMRPHNTGHWTQDGCVTSQFEQHLRAVLDLPLGAVDTLAPVTVMANVLGADEDPAMPMPERVREVMERYPQAKIHLYGKDHRPGRKIGHVNVTGEDTDETLTIARQAAYFLVHAEWA